MKLVIKLLIPILVFMLPQKVEADETHKLYYLKSDILGNDTLVTEKFYFEGKFSDEDILYVLFSNLFGGDFSYIPKSTNLLSISLINGHLVIDVSRDIISYGGGSYYELCMIKQILYTAFDIEGIIDVTLLVEGSLTYLPEGSLIYKITYNDLYCYDN